MREQRFVKVDGYSTPLRSVEKVPRRVGSGYETVVICLLSFSTVLWITSGSPRAKAI